MSKRKRANQSRPSKPVPPPQPQSQPVPPTPIPASVKKADNTWWLYLIIGAVVLLVVGGGIALLANRSTGTPSTAATLSATSTPQRRTNIGRVTACQKNPNFSQNIGLGKRVVASTSTRGMKGLVLFDADNPQKMYQQPGWAALGSLGQFIADRDGNIYVLPAMEISMNNGADLQDKIFKVDTQTGEMKEFVRLPAAGGLSPENPFGVLSLTYDCDTNSLYASTVGGSTSDKQLGRVFRIDIAGAKVTSQFENVDVVGLGVFNGVFGKRLYFGVARSPEVRSVALSDQGDFVGQPRVEFNLGELPSGGDDKARRLLFTDKRELNVRAWPFDYNLRAASETPKRLYHFKYQEQDDTWQFVNAEAVMDGS